MKDTGWRAQPSALLMHLGTGRNAHSRSGLLQGGLGFLQAFSRIDEAFDVAALRRSNLFIVQPHDRCDGVEYAAPCIPTARGIAKCLHVIEPRLERRRHFLAQPRRDLWQGRRVRIDRTEVWNREWTPAFLGLECRLAYGGGLFSERLTNGRLRAAAGHRQGGDGDQEDDRTADSPHRVSLSRSQRGRSMGVVSSQRLRGYTCLVLSPDVMIGGRQ